ncbi:hypothetical protein ACEXQE_17935 [Herbiconiux sp. P17]|uniref:hypothetical protein n=1 Tax=Herbiconiux wuyangfengii TaxID=3342794 RepID=UPI0035B714A7
MAEPRAMSRRERIAAEAAAAAETAAVAAADAASADAAAAVAAAETAAVVEPVPVVTTEIVIVPVAEPAPLTRRQLRDRELLLRSREAELRAEEIADLEIAALDSGALEPAVELALEPVAAEPAIAGLQATEPALHLAPPSRRERKRATRPTAAEAEVVEAEPEVIEAELIDVAAAPDAPASPRGTDARPASSMTAGAATSSSAASALASGTGPAASLAPDTASASASTSAAATSAAAFTTAGGAPSALGAVAPFSGAFVEPFVARSASLALAAPSTPAQLAVAGGGATGPASGSRASVARRALSGRAPKPARTGRRRSGWAKAGLTAVAMTFVLGITAVTAIPSTVSASPVDANVVNLSLNAGTAPAPQQLITAGSASEVVNRDGYAVTDAGELQAAGYSTAQLLVGRSLAQELVNAVDSGKLVGSTPDHIKEIRWIAQGVTVPDCGVDYRVLEIIAIAVRNFDKVGVSDINRKCTGQIEGAGTSSSHYVDGGGHAVDFYILDGKGLDGTDPGTLKLISLLDPVMPVGSHVGQAECRAAAGIKLQLTNWTEFDDSCTHMHVDVPVTDAPLLLTDDSLLAAQ